MRSRLVTFLAVALALVAVTSAAIRFAGFSSPPPTAHAPLPPKLAAYLGVFEPGAPPAFGPIADFTQAAGKQPNLFGFYTGWAGTFDTPFAQMLHKHRIIPFVQVDPTDVSVAAIANGTYDAWLRTYADSVADFGHAVVIGFGHEMNAPWYSWGYGKVPPSTFVAAWRHIVTLFRNEGADNVTWLWTLQADGKGTGPIGSWWPGERYVTWVGIDGYYYSPSDTFATVFGQTIAQVRKITQKPVLLSETAVGPAAAQPPDILGLFVGIRQYGTLGLVWFDKNQNGQIESGRTRGQDWRLEDSGVAEESFRLGVLKELAAKLPYD